MKTWVALAAALALAACGVGGAPVPPGSDEDPRVMELEDDFFN